MLFMAKTSNRKVGRPKKRNAPLDKAGKTGVQLSCRIDEEVDEALRKYCDGDADGEERVKATVVNAALRNYLKGKGTMPQTPSPISQFDGNTERK